MAADDATMAFAKALIDGNIDGIRAGLDAGIDPNSPIPNGAFVESALQIYLGNRGRVPVNLDIVRLLLSRGSNPNGIPGSGMVPLAWATYAYGVQEELARILLDAGADPNGVSTLWLEGEKTRMPTLHLMIRHGVPFPLIQLLVDRGVDVNAVNPAFKYATTALAHAAQKNKIEVARFLLERGANPNQPGDHLGNSPIFLATRNGSTDIVIDLIARGGDPNAHPPSGLPPIHVAIKAPMIAALRAGGADINAKNSRGHTAITRWLTLDYRRGQGPDQTIEILLANGADPNIPGRDDETPLEIALTYRMPSIMVQLITAGANPNIMYEGRALIFEVMEVLNIELANNKVIDPFIQVIQTMIARGVDPNIRGSDGETLLHMIASSAGFEHGKKVITALRGSGVDPNAVDGEGMTVLEMAVYIGYDGSNLAYMIPLGFDPNFMGPAGTALLHRLVAREIDPYWTAEKLARRIRTALTIPTIDVNLRNSAGETALHLAARRNLYDVVEILLNAGADPSLRIEGGDGGAGGALPADLATDVRVKSLLSGSDYAGKTLADIQLLERIFTDPQNISVCPVCLAYSERSDGCRYLMGHICKPEERDEELYQKFKGKTPGVQKRDTIEWCTECGRVTNHHKHYSLSRADGAVPGFAPVDPARQPAAAGGVVHFVDDCRPSGGGGLEEKFVRFHVLVNSFARLQANVGKMSASRARVATIRDVWNAPLMTADDLKAPYAQLATLLRAPPAAGAPEEEVAEWNGRVASLKTFGINLEVFGTEAAPEPAPEEAPAPDVPRPEADRDLNPIRHDPVPAPAGAAAAGGGGEPCILVGGPHDDDRPVFEFRHRQPDGSVYVHPREEWICAPDLVRMIWKRTIDGTCPINPKKCKGLLHPDELVGIFPEELNRDREEMAEVGVDPATALVKYRQFFNKARQAGGKRRKTYRKKTRNATGRRQRGGDDMKTGPEIAKSMSRKIDDDESECLIRPLAL